MIDPRAPNFAATPAAYGRVVAEYTSADPTAAPVVTIVTPFYNTGSVFQETALVIERQTLQQWEWLIINDGSTDPQALALLEAFRTRDPRIQVIDHPVNRGLSAARNTGFRQARAPLVVQIDSDDLLEPTAIEVWAWFLSTHPQYAFARGYTVGFGAETYLWRDGFHRPDGFLTENRVASTAIVRVMAHQAVGGYDEALHGGFEDWDFWLRCANADLWGATVPLFLDWYRRRSNHGDRWANWNRDGRAQFVALAHRRYPRLWRTGMPQIAVHDHLAAPVTMEPPFANQLLAAQPRLLLILPGGNKASHMQGVVHQIARELPAPTIAITGAAEAADLARYAAVTADLFVLAAFLQRGDRPRFLKYLVESRQHAAIFIADPYAATLLPFLRAKGRLPPVIAYLHEPEPGDVAGWEATLSLAKQADLGVCASEALRNRLVVRGVATLRLVSISTDRIGRRLPALMALANTITTRIPRSQPPLDPSRLAGLPPLTLAAAPLTAPGLRARLVELIRNGYYAGVRRGWAWLMPLHRVWIRLIRR